MPIDLLPVYLRFLPLSAWDSSKQETLDTQQTLALPLSSCTPSKSPAPPVVAHLLQPHIGTSRHRVPHTAPRLRPLLLNATSLRRHITQPLEPETLSTSPLYYIQHLKTHHSTFSYGTFNILSMLVMLHHIIQIVELVQSKCVTYLVKWAIIRWTLVAYIDGSLRFCSWLHRIQFGWNGKYKKKFMMSIIRYTKRPRLASKKDPDWFHSSWLMDWFWLFWYTYHE